MKFKFDRQKITLFITKYVSYIINTAIILAVLVGVAWWLQELMASTHMTSYHRHYN